MPQTCPTGVALNSKLLGGRVDLTDLSDTLFKNFFVSGIRKITHFIAFLDTPWLFEWVYAFNFLLNIFFDQLIEL